MICATYDFVFIFHQSHALFELILINIQHVVIDNFLTFVIVFHAIERLNKLIFDETHLLVIARFYRQHLSIIYHLRRVNCFLICMTITLFFLIEFELRATLHLIQSHVLRINDDRFNLRYCVRSMFVNDRHEIQNVFLLKKTLKICDRYMKI